MKKFVIAAAALAVITVSAVEVDVKGDFAQVQKNGIPVGWYANAWEGYKPAPRYEVITEDGARALHFTEIKGKYGFSWGTSLRFAAKAGDKVTVTAKAKGSGSVCFGLHDNRPTAFPLHNNERRLIDYFVSPLGSANQSVPPEWNSNEALRETGCWL